MGNTDQVTHLITHMPLGVCPDFVLTLLWEGYACKKESSELPSNRSNLMALTPPKKNQRKQQVIVRVTLRVNSNFAVYFLYLISLYP